jgi:hypothetical protein
MMPTTAAMAPTTTRPLTLLTGDLRSERQRSDQAQGGHGLRNHQSPVFQREGLKYPTSHLTRQPGQPDRRPKDLHQEPRVPVAGGGLNVALLLQDISQREPEGRQERQKNGHSLPTYFRNRPEHDGREAGLPPRAPLVVPQVPPKSDGFGSGALRGAGESDRDSVSPARHTTPTVMPPTAGRRSARGPAGVIDQSILTACGGLRLPCWRLNQCQPDWL